MNYSKILGLAVSILFISSCATSHKYTSLKVAEARPDGCSLDVYMETDVIKKDYENIGVFIVSDSGFSVKCDLDNAVDQTKKAACPAGAQAIKFTQVSLPSGKSTCVQTKASFLIYK